MNAFERLSAPHDRFAKEVIFFTESRRDWRVFPAGVEAHRLVPRELAYSDHLVAKQYRSQADFIACHTPTGAAFAFDIKVPAKTDRRTVPIELTPVHSHIVQRDRTLFVMEGETHHGNFATAFEGDYIDALAKQFVIPCSFFKGGGIGWVNRCEGGTHDSVDRYVEMIYDAFIWVNNHPEYVRIIDQVRKGVSGDPYILLCGEGLAKLPHWKKVVRDRQISLEADGRHVLERRAI